MFKLIFIQLVVFQLFAASYPKARQEPTQLYKHGYSLSDPFLWMQNVHDPELQIWIKNQNTHSDTILNSTLRDELIEEFKSLTSQRGFSMESPVEERNRYFHRFAPLSRKNNRYQSQDGKYTIRLTSESGSDLLSVRIYDEASKSYTSDLLQVKFADFHWEEEGRSFIYVSDRDGRLGDSRPIIRRHTLGEKQLQDKILFVAPKPDTWLSLTPYENKWILTQYGTETSYSWLDLQSGKLTDMWKHPADSSRNFAFEEGLVYQIRYDDNDLGQIVTRKLSDGSVSVITSSNDFAIDQAVKKGDVLYLSVVDRAANRVRSFHLKTRQVKELKLPGEGSARLAVGGDKLILRYQSFTERVSKWELNEESEQFVQSSPAAAPHLPLESRRVEYRAHDGRQANIWLVYKKGLELNSQTPTLLYGYGGFAINVLPRYRDQLVPFFKRGGVFASVTLPGGLEYGLKWRESGRGSKKHNVFTDFAQAGQRLIALGLTSPEKLGASGGSNGGLLVGATVNRFPSLFKAAIPEVGVMDMINFQLFTGGKWWTYDYGNREVKDDFINQLSLSPYHNLKRNNYPATFVVAADFDDRVVPSHSYRYAAKLQKEQSANLPVLLHTRIHSSHGKTGSKEETIRYLANKWTFVLQQLNGLK